MPTINDDLHRATARLALAITELRDLARQHQYPDLLPQIDDAQQQITRQLTRLAQWADELEGSCARVIGATSPVQNY
jgi:hypothetical protein